MSIVAKSYIQSAFFLIALYLSNNFVFIQSPKRDNEQLLKAGDEMPGEKDMAGASLLYELWQTII